MNCPYYGFPGCPSPLPYEEECAKKRKRLSTLFGQDVPFTPHPAPDNYRIRMDFVTTPEAKGLRRTTHDDIVDVQRCPILNERLNDVWMQVREWIETVSCYDGEQGWLRYVMLRGAQEVQVTLTTSTTDHEDAVRALYDSLDIESLVWTINDTDRDISVGSHHKTFGTDTITVRIGDIPFLIDHESFFQASPDAMELAIDRMREHVQEKATVLDLYCGVGTIGIALSPERLIGVEANDAAVILADRNAKNQNIDAVFSVADAQQALVKTDADVVVVDPPRTGLQMAVHRLLAAAPDTIIYLSCNPRSMRTDVAALKRSYDVTHLEGFDFFPRTDHIECLAVLRKR